MFEGGGGKGVQGVIKHYNSVSLPRAKEGQAEKKRRGEMKGSPTSMSGREEGGGGEKINKASLKVLHSAYFSHL